MYRHGIHAICAAYPSQKIFMAKKDLNAAYRRLHVLSKWTIRAITVFKNLAFIELRLPFGVSGGHSIYSCISEAVFDFVNDILKDTSWDSDVLHASH